MKTKIGILLGGVLLLIIVSPVTAHHKARVLGESTSSSELVFPPITYGPGYILPDSPLYVLDRVFQQVRLATAFAPERKAKIHAQIAGERLAELRVMMERENKNGITTALHQLNQETTFASKDLSDAAAAGKDVSDLAKTINDNFKLHRQVLSELVQQTNGSLSTQIQATNQSLKEAKAEVEDHLDEVDLNSEIREDIEVEIEDSLHEAQEATEKLEVHVEDLTHEASEEAKREEQKERLVKKAQEEKMETLRREQERMIRLEKKNQHELLKKQEKAAKEARKAIEEAKKAALEREKAKRKEEEIRTNPSVVPLENLTPPIQIRTENSRSGSTSSGSSEDEGEDKNESNSGGISGSSSSEGR